MAKTITIQGIERIKFALLKMETNLKPFAKKFGRTAGGEIRNVARKNINSDTGALDASVHVTVGEALNEVKIKVIAGKPDIRRGEGKFAKGRGGQGVSLLATDQYAQAHEDNTHYMQTAADFSVKSMGQAIVKAVKLMLRSV